MSHPNRMTTNKNLKDGGTLNAKYSNVSNRFRTVFIRSVPGRLADALVGPQRGRSPSRGTTPATPHKQRLICRFLRCSVIFCAECHFLRRSVIFCAREVSFPAPRRSFLAQKCFFLPPSVIFCSLISFFAP